MNSGTAISLCVSVSVCVVGGGASMKSNPGRINSKKEKSAGLIVPRWPMGCPFWTLEVGDTSH